MTKALWKKIDRYFAGHLITPDEDLEAVIEESAAAGLPPMAVSAALGKFLYLQIKALGARRVLELGTMAGYSTIWMGKALKENAPEDGFLLTLELQGAQTEMAKKNIARAGLTDMVEILEGDARKTLPQLVEEKTDAFDFIFLDADKVSYPLYFDDCLALSKPGTVMIVDNVVLHGAVTENPDLPAARGIRELTEKVAKEPRVSATTLQTVGDKGHDGIMMIYVR